LKIAGQCIETVMRASLGLFSVDGHPALVALVGARATVLLMVHDVEPLDFLVAVNARHHHIGTCCLVQIYIFAQGLGLALGESFALYRLIVAVLIVGLHVVVAEGQEAAQVFVFAVELHRVELLLDFFANVDEARLFALERTLACFSRKLIQTHLMEPVLALFALPWVLQNGRAQSTQKVS